MKILNQVVEQAKLALKVTPDQAGQPTAENLDRPSLDQDLPVTTLINWLMLKSQFLQNMVIMTK